MLKGLYAGLVELVYPKKCPACKKKPVNDKTGDFLCGECRGMIKPNLPPFCHSCGRRLDIKGFAKNICPSCLKNRMHFDRAFSPYVFEGPIRDLVHEFKYGGKDYLGSHLSAMIINFIREYRIGIDYMDAVIAMPLSAVRLREREFNQAEILAKDIAQEFKKELLTGTLCRLRHGATQTELAPEKRAANVAGAFSVAHPEAVQNKNLVLVDDVLTTGATSSEAARQLKSAGARIVFVLTLAN